MKITAALVLVALTPSVAALVAYRGKNFLSAEMQPNIAAQSLAKVAEEWQAQVHAFTECKAGVETGVVTHCDEASTAFRESCDKTADAIVQGSHGDADNAAEYMNAICSQTSISGWRQKTCVSLAKAVTSRMSASSFDNRDSFKTDKSCDSVWSFLVDEEIAQQKALKAQEIKEREAEIAEQKAAEEKKALEAKKAAEEKKAAQKAAEEKKAAQKAADEAKAKKAAELKRQLKQKAAHFGCVHACEPEIVESTCVTQCEAEFYMCDGTDKATKKCQDKVLDKYQKQEKKQVDKKKDDETAEKDTKKDEKKAEKEKSDEKQAEDKQNETKKKDKKTADKKEEPSLLQIASRVHPHFTLNR